MGVMPVHVAGTEHTSALKSQTGGSGSATFPDMVYVTDAKAGSQALQASADAYIIGGTPPASITITVSGAFENKNGYTSFNTEVRGEGAARFYKAWPSSCFEYFRSAANIDGRFFGKYTAPTVVVTWGPGYLSSSKACSNPDPCNDGITRKSRGANLNSGVCDEDAPIYGAGGEGDAPTDDPAPAGMHCWWYRDVMAFFDPNTGKLLYAVWLNEWTHECEEMTVVADDHSATARRIPVVLRARGPLGATGRPVTLVAEAGDTVAIAIDTTRATGSDVDAALSRAGSMWNAKAGARTGGVFATALAPQSHKRESSRGDELLRAVKARQSSYTPNRGKARELRLSVPRRP